MVPRPYFSALVILAGLAAAVPAHADDWPSRSVYFTVPLAPGGVIDLVAREVAAEMSELYHQPFIVENKAGGQGLIAVDYVSKQKPDGYNLLFDTDSLSELKYLIPSATIDLDNDLTPVTLVVKSYQAMIVSTKLPANNPREFAAYAKAHPGEVKWGIAGFGSVGHMSMARFAKMAGFEPVLVPYKGNAPALTATMGGEVDGLMAVPSTANPAIAAGKVKALGIGSPEPIEAMPGVPTIASFGFDGYQSGTWHAVWGPKGMSNELATQIRDAIAKALAAPDLRKKIVGDGNTPTASASPAAFAAYFKEETVHNTELLRELNIHLQE